MESFSLSRLNAYVRRVITLNFQDPVWVTAEILSIKEKGGHYYLELTEKDEQELIVAQSSAIIWKTAYQRIQHSSDFDPGQILHEGHEIRILVEVDFSIRYGLKLMVQSIDGAFTMGKIALGRIRIIERLRHEGLWQLNKSKEIPQVIQKIAVIASRSSAGFKDFEAQLVQNPSGLSFQLYLLDVSVQGSQAVESICKAFTLIGKKKSAYDVVVLIRGGGSKIDLHDFDSYALAASISQCDYPVLTGIGHHIDESIADLSACQSFKTPTAVAAHILEVNLSFRERIQALYLSAKGMAANRHRNQAQQLVICSHLLSQQANRIKHLHQSLLAGLRFRLRKELTRSLQSNTSQLKQWSMLLDVSHPDAVLKKGYSLTYKDDILLQSIDHIDKGDEIKTVFHNGLITSKTDRSWRRKN